MQQFLLLYAGIFDFEKNVLRATISETRRYLCLRLCKISLLLSCRENPRRFSEFTFKPSFLFLSSSPKMLYDPMAMTITIDRRNLVTTNSNHHKTRTPTKLLSTRVWGHIILVVSFTQPLGCWSEPRDCIAKVFQSWKLVNNVVRQCISSNCSGKKNKRTRPHRQQKLSCYFVAASSDSYREKSTAAAESLTRTQ